ncbi:Gfo/Idh/MocA family oxidoreductase [Cerasibacillus terrae]|uniref:Gfo/Idh/MocA family oxidoreductase n=1 Tax=Cerasibacillus terrae TaxID=2498845 RepID=A0A5C8NJQ4_9BACI|nr:Gfo/Idh/MocA family oxidoreductase [Cerasibacillus terrae]TXL61085.1 Gfo/Idh/MocA family oxidoreductase [Cerasibacillus terrae]
MRVGIISFAHGHAYSYTNTLAELEGVKIAGIADENENRGIKAAKQFNTKHYLKYEDLLNEPIDAVIITSENSNHYKHVKAAAKKGIHILCEKPLAHNLKDAQAIIEVCNEHQVILQMAFPVRFNTPVMKGKEIIDSGQLGRLIAIKATNRGTNPAGWFADRSKSGGGAVIDHTVHVVDIMRWYMGAEVKEVYAEVGNLISELNIDDSGMLTMEFDNNVFATLDCSWSRNKGYPTWGDVTLEIIGTNGTLTIDAFGQKNNVYNNEKVYWDFWGDNMNKKLIIDFISTVREGKRPSITGEDGLKALGVAIAAYESSEKNEPIKLK